MNKYELFLRVLPFVALAVILFTADLLGPGFRRTHHAQSGGTRAGLVLKAGVFILFVSLGAVVALELSAR